MKTTMAALAIALLISAGSHSALAQVPAQIGPAGQPANVQSDRQDQMLAKWLAAENFVEVKLSELAAEKADSDKVKELASKIRDDHKEFCDRVAQALPGISLEIAEKDEDRDQALVRRGPVAGVQADELKRQIAQERVARFREEMKDLDGKKFDAAYLGHQVIHHHNLLATLDVLEQQASPQLKEVIKKERESAQEHLDEAKGLMKELADRDDDNS